MVVYINVTGRTVTQTSNIYMCVCVCVCVCAYIIKISRSVTPKRHHEVREVEFESVIETINVYVIKLVRKFKYVFISFTYKGKSVPLQAWSGPEGSRKLRFTDFMTTAQDGDEVVSLTHRPPLPKEMILVLISARG